MQTLGLRLGRFLDGVCEVFGGWGSKKAFSDLRKSAVISELKGNVRAWLSNGNIVFFLF